MSDSTNGPRPTQREDSGVYDPGTTGNVGPGSAVAPGVRRYPILNFGPDTRPSTTWIRTDPGLVINAAHLHTLSVRECGEVRKRRSGDGWVTNHNAPKEGHCVVGWDNSEPVWITGGHPAHIADAVLENLFLVLSHGGGSFDVQQFIVDITPIR